jgi:hypothetical protein
MEELWSYKRVREYFGWKSNASIRVAITAGTLTRVYVSKADKGARITAASCIKRMADLQNDAEARKQFNVPEGVWASWKEAKQHKKESAEQAANLDVAMVAKHVYVNEWGDTFAPSPEGSTDPISGQYSPPGTYRDESDTLICGLPSPAESQRIFVARCKLRGIRPTVARYQACIIDGAGRYRVNDVPEEQRSRPTLVFTKPMGTAGGV